jgi:hypothetical protein
LVHQLKDFGSRSTLEKKIVKRYDLLLRVKHFLVVEGYDPRIHAVYFCPQLYKYDTDKKLVPLQGEEIGRLIAHSVEGGIRERRPWYQPSEELRGINPRRSCRISRSLARRWKWNLIPWLFKCLKRGKRELAASSSTRTAAAPGCGYESDTRRKIRSPEKAARQFCR